MIAAPERRIRSLQLRTASASQARQAATLVEDALRTATLPFADRGQLIVIRRLCLGRLPPSASSATWALHLERATRDLAASAVRFDTPSAATAPAVCFPDRAAALVALARRFARHEPVTEWFWGSAFPEWTTRLPAARLWLRLLECSQMEPGATLVAASIVDQAAQADRLEEILAAVPDTAAARWLRVAGWDSAIPQSSAVPPGTIRFAPELAACLRRHGAADNPPRPAALWVASLLAVAHRPALLHHPDLPAAIRTALLPGTTAPTRAAARRQTTPTTTAQTEPADRPASPESPAGSIDAKYALDTPGSEGMRAWPAAGVTDFAGLLFLVPLLERLGFARWLGRLAPEARADFPFQLLLRIGQRFNWPHTDPLRVWLTDHLASAARSDRHPTDPHGLAWLSALRRQCRRRTGLHLRPLICRPGSLSVTRAHCDLSLPADQVDLRIRRAGLDLDPGWVPWLSAVVQFHYTTSDGY